MNRRYEVTTCTGKHVEFVSVRIPKELHDAHPIDIKAVLEERVLSKAKCKQFVCQGCYDQHYHVKDAE